MKKIIFSVILTITAAGISAAHDRQGVVIGSAVNGAPNTVVIGEAVSGTPGSNNDWHVTLGQLQGIKVVSDVSASENITEGSVGYSVYPNPAHDVINVSRPNASPAVLTLNALSGATAFMCALTEQQSAIDLSSVAPGAYILVISRDDIPETYTVKIIKQ